MNTNLVGLAFAAGLVAALNPCGFAMLPAYLAFVVSSAEHGRMTAVTRAVLATVAMTLGFLAVFAVFGTLSVALASTIQRYLPVLTVVVGVVLMIVGGWLLAGRQLHFALPGAARLGERGAPTARLASMFGYGVAYAVASLSCTVGPFLAVTAAGAGSATVSGAAATYLAYAAGFALIVGTLAVAAAFTSVAVAVRLRRILPVISRVGGAVVALVGLYVAYYGVYELRLFHTDAGPDDVVIRGAGRLQAALAAWVHTHGGWPWAAGLVAVVAMAAGWAWRTKLRSR